ncbi:MAG TPA: TonB-dependent receptor [Steroidobacteraceae bacterium]
MNRPIAAGLLAAPFLTLLPLHAATAADANATGGTPVSTVTVIGTTPLPGADIDASQVPAPVQKATSQDIDRTHAADLTEFMKRSLGSVYVNEMQENPLQPDINFRGYTASPLLGTPQGMSVYLDGMRLNEPFGDVVNWDLIPRAAISSVQLMPGSNPLFGQNTLGGALSIQTKDGWSNPGLAAQVAYGSHAQRTAEFEYGGNTPGGLSWYLTGNKFKDAGWREFSPTDAGQIFGKAGWKNEDTKVTLSGAWAKTNLTGNGLQDPRLLAQDYDSVYTIPDKTANNSKFVDLALTHSFSSSVSVSANAFYRANSANSFNGDINDDAVGENLYQPSAAERAALTAAGYTGFPTSGETQANTPFPQWRCIGAVLLVGQVNASGGNVGEPDEKCNGIDTSGHTSLHETGISAQLAWATGSDPLHNTLIGGFSLGESSAHFVQGAQFGYLTPQRTVTLVNCPATSAAPYCDPFADGIESTDDGDVIDSRVDLTGRTSTRSVYLSDVLSVGRLADFTLSARYDYTSIRNRDGIDPAAGPGSLTADNHFDHVNPAFGAVLHMASWIDGYASWSESSRAPSAVELGCDDPDNQCRLPNALAGDPPGALKQVVTETVELGFRGSVGSLLSWSAGVFRGNNRDDIMFISDIAGNGYFANFGDTRRQGIELSATGRAGPVSLGANFTLLDATFRSPLTLEADGNSTNDGGFYDEGNIDVSPGNRIPLVPRQVFKTWAQWDVTHQLSLDADVQYTGWSYSRGNENNGHEPDGTYFLGPGYSGGFTVANLGIEFRPVEHVKLFFQVNNVFDKRYATASALGTTSFTPAGAFVSRPFPTVTNGDDFAQVAGTFYSPGAPRSFFGGARYTFW